MRNEFGMKNGKIFNLLADDGPMAQELTIANSDSTRYKSLHPVE